MKVDIWTDGAIKGHTKQSETIGGMGFHWITEDDELYEASLGPFIGGGNVTNNVLEVGAAIMALEQLAIDHGECEVTVHTDSKYLRDNATNYLKTWQVNGFLKRDGKPAANKEIWLRLSEMIERHLSVVFVWVKGHDKDQNNERADRLAVEGKERAAEPDNLYRTLGVVSTSLRAVDEADKPSRQLKDFKSVNAYAERVRPEGTEISFSGYNKIVFITEENDYFKEGLCIKFTREGDVLWASETLPPPTEEEAAQIAAEFARFRLPKPVSVVGSVTGSSWRQLPDLPDDVKTEAEENIWLFWHHEQGLKGTSVRIETICQRIQPEDGEKRYWYWTYFDDGVWRVCEPEDFHFLYGLPEAYAAVRANRIVLHEGQKAARAAISRVDWPSEWSDLFKHAVHIGWCGGVNHPHKVKWSKLVSLAKFLHVSEIIIVPDADEAGMVPIREIAASLAGFDGQVYVVNWYDLPMPQGWDFADEFPAELVSDGQWLGPPAEALLNNRTWATDVIDRPTRGGVVFNLRSAFAKNWCYVSSINSYVHRDTPRELMNKETFVNAVRMVSDEGTANRVPEKLHVLEGSNAQSITFNPNRATGIIASAYCSQFNRYVDYRPPPLAGSVDEFRKSVRLIVPDEDHRHALLNWMATLVAYPGRRMNFGVLISGGQGAGKGLIGQVLERTWASRTCPTSARTISCRATSTSS